MSQIINIESGKIVGVRTSFFTIFNSEKHDPMAIPTAWREFFSKAQGTDLLKDSTLYGASVPSISLDVPMDYVAGALVPSDYEIPEGFESLEIDAGNYWTHLHSGPITGIGISYQNANMKELPASGQEMRPAPHLEIYNSTLDPMAVDYEMVIAVPVV